ncbi:MAG TPA: rhodanese-like domain-containing protein [Candidatus Hodarchaeales archaeon]|nr:rhodanese-like domain-containing protein [Candidatus Hodarchaeales archaeon]
MNHLKIGLIIWFVISLQATMVTEVHSENPMDETNFKNLILSNSDTVIIDIRWMDLYKQGHIRGAYLIDSSLSSGTKLSLALGFISSEGANTSTPIALYCNCPNGEEASYLEAALNNQGYQNTAFFEKSFALWQDFSMLVSGQNRDGPALTTSPPTPPGGEQTLILVGIGAVVLVGAGAFLYTRDSVGTKKYLNGGDRRSEKKKMQEIDSIQQLLTERRGKSDLGSKKSHK